LRLQLRSVKDWFSSEREILFIEYYNGISNSKLKEIFPILHAGIDELFDFMNSKNRPGAGGHYNADESRKLYEFIERFRIMKVKLQHTPLAFRIDEYYENLLDRCMRFISKSSGSPIPEEFPAIDIIKDKPIFFMLGITEVKRTNGPDLIQTHYVGEGSYAHVYMFTDTHYNQIFALKRAKKDLTAKELIRFKNEFVELSKLDSPYIIKVYNYNDEKKEYTMEYVKQTLAEYMRANNTKLSMGKRVGIINQIFKAFKYIHSKDLLHRDISNHNILIKIHDDETTIVKVSDFGLVKIKESSLTSNDSSIKGYLNDPGLAITGFNNYEIRHEIYTLSQVINFVLTGKTNGGLYDQNKAVHDFLARGYAADIEERYGSVDQMITEFSKVRDYL